MKAALFLACVLLSPLASAQIAIPAGTTLPVTLRRTLDVRKLKAGDAVVVMLAQSVPLGSSLQARAGTRLSGRVVEARFSADKHQGSSLTLSFDHMLLSGAVPIVTHLRAIASPLEVTDAQIPKTGPDRGTSSASYTTVQIGGDVVYRGGGPVMHGGEVVGTPVADGVLVRLAADPERHCGATPADAATLQATSVFASVACGVYGFADLTIAHAGRTAPVGQIVLTSSHGPIKLRAGSELLLRVNATAPNP